MLNNKGFDLWANEYDKSVNLSEEADAYPFAGYKNVLNAIYNYIRQGRGKEVLDIGFGTGVLAKKLYDEGYSIWGVDFSEKMIAIAKEKMPKATLLLHDFTQGLPADLGNRVFDCIVCTYAIHHLDDLQKIKFIRALMELLSPGGKVLIGDVAFETTEELEQCKQSSGGGWDDDERYPVADVLKPAFPLMGFEKISFCAGMFILTK